jgi:hypothetical protein
MTMLCGACGFKKVSDFYFEKRCHRDLPGIWAGESCPRSAVDSDALEGDDENGANRERPCALAINPSLCIKEGIEHSVWRSDERKADIALTYQISIQSYYEFRPDGGYSHYLVLTHPFLDKRYYEKREGTLLLEPNDAVDALFYTHTLDFDLASTSCAGSEAASLFQIFDASNKSQIARNEYQISLQFPDIDIEVAGNSFGSFIAQLIFDFTELIYEVLLAPLTPNFWKEVVTGPLHWEAVNQEDLTQVIDSSEELCFSKDGFQSLVPKLNIPATVQFILLSQ